MANIIMDKINNFNNNNKIYNVSLFLEYTFYHPIEAVFEELRDIT